jgi:hypothetical protein
MRRATAAETWRNVLRFSNIKVPQSKIGRAYVKWRSEQNIPDRCDNPKCQFHKGPLMWNGKALKLILDHIEGNRFDNSPNSLRYLCPNCDSQLPTRGGGNKGRVVDVTSHGYTLMNRDGSRIVAATARARGRSSASFVGASIQASPASPTHRGLRRLSVKPDRF